MALHDLMSFMTTWHSDLIAQAAFCFFFSSHGVERCSGHLAIPDGWIYGGDTNSMGLGAGIDL